MGFYVVCKDGFEQQIVLFLPCRPPYRCVFLNREESPDTKAQYSG